MTNTLTMKRRFWLPVLLAALVFYLVAPNQPHVQLFAQQTGAAAEPEGTPAEEDLATSDGKGGTMKCSDLPEAKGGVLLGRIVPCITHTIEVSTQSFSAAMIAMLMPTFYAFLVFVISLFGVKILEGGQDLHKEAIMLVLKITLVLMFLQLIPYDLVPKVYQLMNEMQGIVTSTLGSGASSIHCEISNYGDENTPLIWAQMDCVLGKLYGFSTGKPSMAGGESRNMFLAASMFGAAAGFFFSGTFGITVFLACVGVLISLFMLVLRTATAFLNGYLMVCVLLIISPLFMPLVFMRATKKYFDQWTTIMLSALIMPVLITAYSIFALLLYDKMLFAPDALVNKLFEYDVIQKAQQAPVSGCDKQITGEPDFRQQTGIVKMALSTFYKSKWMENLASKNTSGAGNACATLKKQVLDFGAIDSPEFKNAKKAFENIFNTCIKLIILGFLISTGLEKVTGMITLMTGSSAVMNAISASSPQEKMVQQKLSEAQNAAYKAMSVDKDGKPAENRGADFVGRIGPTISATIGGFVKRE